MKYLILLMGLFFGLNCSAQEPIAAIESPEMNILYRGYPNRIIPAVTNNDGRRISISLKNGSVSNANGEVFIVRPGIGKKCTITVSLIDENGQIEVIRSVDYRVYNLPVPSIYWGGFREGGKGNIRGHNLFAKYPPEIPLNACFSVLKWTIMNKTDTISGEGASLRPAQELFKKITKEVVLNFTVDFVGPDGIRRRKNVYWTVIPWEEEKDMNPIEIRD